MKIMLKRILRSERGQALPMALILLVLGGFLVVPTLALMTTNLTANRMIDRANLELYAADAGVENVLWEIMYNKNFTLPGDGQTQNVPTPSMNGRTVTATISKVTGQTNIYKITSIATGTDGHSTKIECFVDAGSKYSFLFDNAITSAGKVTLKPNVVVEGDVRYGTTLDQQPGSIITGTATPDPTLSTRWPTQSELDTYYDVNNLPPSGFGNNYIIDVKNYKTTGIGPFRHVGNLNIDNSDTPATMKLNGTIYVTGKLTFKQPGASKDYTIDLNNQTIYAVGDITADSEHINFTGSGSIISVNTIDIKPGTGNSYGEFILILSLTKKATFWPKASGAEFYGSVAGFTEAYIGSGRIITGPPPDTFKFPGMGGGAGGGLGGKAKLLTYTINPH